MKKIISIVISILIFVVGLGVMFYPTVSNWLHEQNASYAVSNYLSSTTSKTNEEYAAEFESARAYNATLSGDVKSFMEAENAQVQNADYWNTLDQVDGIMGIIEIPTINVTLPIYHGTDETALQKGAGHLEGSALPTGDVGNHTVITGHTGLPSAMLFTDLDELSLGDFFYLEILDQVFSYEIVNIYVVLPSETENLAVQADKDLVTLVTCTPYGVNSHRLLIQGQRSDAQLPASLVSTPASEHLVSDVSVSHVLDSLPVLAAVALCFGVLLLVAIVYFATHGRLFPKRVANRKEAKAQAKEAKKRKRQKQRDSLDEE